MPVSATPFHPPEDPAPLVTLARSVLRTMLRQGADEAEVMVQHSVGCTMKVHEGKVDEVKQGEDKGLGIRFFKNKRLSEGHSTDLHPAALKTLIRRTAEFSESVASDPHHSLAPSEKSPGEKKLALYQDDFSTLPQSQKLKRLMSLEKIGLGQAAIRLSDGANYHEARTTTVLLNSLGQKIIRQSTGASVWIGLYAADEKHGQQAAWEGTAARSLQGLGDWNVLAVRAADEARCLLGAKPIATGPMAVVFNNQQSGVLFSGLLGAMKGSRLANRNSYLLGRVGKKVAGKNIQLIEDPFLPGALGSGVYDGEGTPKTRKVLIDQGRFTGFVFNRYYASKCKTATTGNASRTGYGGGIGIGFSNVLLEGAAGMNEADVVDDTPDGLLVMGTMGMGVNPVTGEFSLGAYGRRIRKGKLAEPVANVTIAGRLQEILCNIDLIADDARPDTTLRVPTLRVTQMMVAGK